MMTSIARRWSLVPLVLGVLGSTAPGPAVGGLVVYQHGQDDGVGPPPPPPNPVKTNEGLKAFTDAVGPFSTITFEGLPTGPYTNPPGTVPPSIALGQGATAMLSGVETSPPSAYVFGISSDHPSAVLGYNTTPGGSQFLRFVPLLGTAEADLTIKFGSSVTAFGMTITGLGGRFSGQLYLHFSGVTQDLLIVGTPNGGSQFIGVSNLPTPVGSFTLRMLGTTNTERDIISIDDVRFAAVPEPGSAALLAGGLAVAAFAVRRRAA